MKSIFPNAKPSKGTLLDALARMGDAEGLEPVEGDTMLSTPIGASTQDGPRMTSQFSGHKAAPFVKGGGRSKTHPNDAKGRKRKAAKVALAKGKTKDYSNVDLGFFAGEKRDNKGKWAKGGPTWMPEKGARSKAEFDHLQAKNTLAKARLSGNLRDVAKAKAKVNTTGAALAAGRKIVDGYRGR